MPLSFSKLVDFLGEKGFIPKKVYTYENACFYIELLSVKDAEQFFLYIPSKYFIEPDNFQPTIKMKQINMSSSKNITDEYGDTPDIQDIYGEVPINLYDEEKDFEEHLENNYKHSISLEKINKDDIQDIKSVYRQLKRLKFSVQNISYKVAIVFKNYICVIRRDDSIDCFSVKTSNIYTDKQFYIICDLDRFLQTCN